MSCLLKISLFHTSTLHHILSTPDSLRGWVKRKCSPQEEQIQIETWGRNEGRDSVCPFPLSRERKKETGIKERET